MLAYVIGSISQVKEIKDLADNLLKTYDEVRYVRSQPEVSKEELIRNCFDNISQCDDIYVISKPDGSLGDGVLYEIEYAKRLDKNINIIHHIS